MNNSIFVIKPYKWEPCWVFDAPVDLVREPFVGGADTMIDVVSAHIPNADQAKARVDVFLPRTVGFRVRIGQPPVTRCCGMRRMLRCAVCSRGYASPP
jgi:hypothetical protein